MTQYGKYLVVSELEKLSMKTMYRLLLKNMKSYPSNNRFELLQQVHEEFRKYQHPPAEDIPVLRKKVEIGLRHVMYYIEKNNQLLAGNYHDRDMIEPLVKSKDEQIYM